MSYPHDTYAAAIAQALEAGQIAPDEWETWSDDDVRMTAVYRWTDDDQPRHNPTAYPHGLLLAWHSDRGWEYGRMRRHGSIDNIRQLPVPLYAAPGAVADAIRVALTSATAAVPGDSRQWQHADQLAADLPEQES